jgi:hypothetical protein
MGADPLGGASIQYWEPIKILYGLDITLVHPVAGLSDRDAGRDAPSILTCVEAGSRICSLAASPAPSRLVYMRPAGRRARDRIREEVGGGPEARGRSAGGNRGHSISGRFGEQLCSKENVYQKSIFQRQNSAVPPLQSNRRHSGGHIVCHQQPTEGTERGTSRLR